MVMELPSPDKVPRVVLGPFKSLEIEFAIKGLLSPLVQPMGPF